MNERRRKISAELDRIRDEVASMESADTRQQVIDLIGLVGELLTEVHSVGRTCNGRYTEHGGIIGI